MTHATLTLTPREQQQIGLFAVPEDAELDALSPLQKWCTECETWVIPVTHTDMFGKETICPNCGAEI